ncbi:hypothetical protein C0081_07820 [Cohaesibacter celericrescens]|uniref:Uncharacterized protein n=1 Tax=Cohaesibacter celericrescens TaxID=2067669 RepID=A0A2N5XTK3_9HYPH|nr:hypothetical protein C0081_07820 [Cohaesibacter celericrescens]
MGFNWLNWQMQPMRATELRADDGLAVHGPSKSLRIRLYFLHPRKNLNHKSNKELHKNANYCIILH